MLRKSILVVLLIQFVTLANAELPQSSNLLEFLNSAYNSSQRPLDIEDSTKIKLAISINKIKWIEENETMEIDMYLLQQWRDIRLIGHTATENMTIWTPQICFIDRQMDSLDSKLVVNEKGSVLKFDRYLLNTEFNYTGHKYRTRHFELTFGNCNPEYVIYRLFSLANFSELIPNARDEFELLAKNDTLLTFNNQQQIDEGQIFGEKYFTFQPKVHPFDDNKTYNTSVVGELAYGYNVSFIESIFVFWIPLGIPILDAYVFFGILIITNIKPEHQQYIFLRQVSIVVYTVLFLYFSLMKYIYPICLTHNSLKSNYEVGRFFTVLMSLYTYIFIWCHVIFFWGPLIRRLHFQLNFGKKFMEVIDNVRLQYRNPLHSLVVDRRLQLLVVLFLLGIPPIILIFLPLIIFKSMQEEF